MKTNEIESKNMILLGLTLSLGDILELQTVDLEIQAL
jgi:hypothetical protein